MKCPICQFSEITENTSNCPKCNSDLVFIDNIKLVSKKIKMINFYFILVFIVLIIIIFTSFFTLNKYKKNDGSNNNILIEELKQENIVLKNTIAEMNKKQATDTVKVSDKINSDKINSDKTDEVTEYIVQKDDNLWTIAQKFYNDGFKFKVIAMDNNIKRPYEILVGTKLIIKKY